MERKPEIQYVGQFYVQGSAAPQIGEKQKKKKATLPRLRREKLQKVYVDPVALCGMAVGACLLFGQRFTGSNVFFRTLICSAVAAGMALLLVRAGLGQSQEYITIGTLMVLVPGMALTNAMREIMAGDIISGLTRTAEVLLVA